MKNILGSLHRRTKMRQRELHRKSCPKEADSDLEALETIAPCRSYCPSDLSSDSSGHQTRRWLFWPNMLYRQWMSFAVCCKWSIETPLFSQFGTEYVVRFSVHANLRTESPALEMSWLQFIWMLLALGIDPHALNNINDNYSLKLGNRGQVKISKGESGYSATVQMSSTDFCLRGAFAAANIMLLNTPCNALYRHVSRDSFGRSEAMRDSLQRIQGFHAESLDEEGKIDLSVHQLVCEPSRGMRQLTIKEKLMEALRWAYYCESHSGDMLTGRAQVSDELVHVRKLSLFFLYQADREGSMQARLGKQLPLEQDVTAVQDFIKSCWNVSRDTCTAINLHKHVLHLAMHARRTAEFDNPQFEDLLSQVVHNPHTVVGSPAFEKIIEPLQHRDDGIQERQSRLWHIVEQSIRCFSAELYDGSLETFTPDTFCASDQPIWYCPNLRDLDSPLAILANVMIALQPWNNSGCDRGRPEICWPVRDAIVRFQEELKQLRQDWLDLIGPEILDETLEDMKEATVYTTIAMTKHESSEKLDLVEEIHRSPDSRCQTIEGISVRYEAKRLTEILERGLGAIDDGIFDPPKNPIDGILQRGYSLANPKVFVN